MEAEALFKDRLSGVVDEQETTQELLKLLEYLPLAIVQAAALQNGWKTHARNTGRDGSKTWERASHDT
jgi:hypothetical protein